MASEFIRNKRLLSATTAITSLNSTRRTCLHHFCHHVHRLCWRFVREQEQTDSLVARQEISPWHALSHFHFLLDSARISMAMELPVSLKSITFINSARTCLQVIHGHVLVLLVLTFYLLFVCVQVQYIRVERDISKSARRRPGGVPKNVSSDDDATQEQRSSHNCFHYIVEVKNKVRWKGGECHTSLQGSVLCIGRSSLCLYWWKLILRDISKCRNKRISCPVSCVVVCSRWKAQQFSYLNFDLL